MSHAREIRAMFIQPPQDAPQTVHLHSGKKSFELELPSRSLSPEVKVPNGELVFAVLPEALAAGATPPEGAPTVTIPESWSRCILLFFPDPKNPVVPARIMPVDGSTARFPKGETLIYNVSSATMVGKFGDKVVSVKPGKTGVVKPPRDSFGAYPVAIDCILKGSKNRKAVCRTNWQHDPEARQILFVTPPSPGNKVPRVWGVLDHEISKEAKNAKGS